MWNIQTGVLVHELTGLDSTSVKQINSAQIAIGKGNSNIDIYDINTYQYVATLSGHTFGVTCLEMLNNGLLVSGSHDNKVKIWNTTTRLSVKTFDPLSASVLRVRQLADGTLVMCGESHVMARYNLSIGGTNQLKAEWSNLIESEQQCNDLLVSTKNIIMATLSEIKLVNQSNNVYYMSFNELIGTDGIFSLEKIESMFVNKFFFN